jgi:hypothetical protein
LGMTDARSENDPDARTVGFGLLAGGAGGGVVLPAPVLNRNMGCSSMAFSAVDLRPARTHWRTILPVEVPGRFQRTLIAKEERQIYVLAGSRHAVSTRIPRHDGGA